MTGNHQRASIIGPRALPDTTTAARIRVAQHQERHGVHLTAEQAWRVAELCRHAIEHCTDPAFGASHSQVQGEAAAILAMIGEVR